MRRRTLLALVSLLTASILCVGLVEIRTLETGDGYYRFLIWNLFLAWVPLGFAAAIYASGRRRLGPLAAALLVPWLLFFPNAPYLLTDFVHLETNVEHGRGGPAPIWYDALMLSAFAWTGLLLGFASLHLVQLVVRRALGVAAGWIAVVVALALGSFGVYVGRFVRVNSWDALLDPLGVLDVLQDHHTAAPLRLPEALVALTAFLLVGYVAVYSITGLAQELEPADRAPDPPAGA
jgi:uncharacterized membrane protein